MAPSEEKNVDLKPRRARFIRLTEAEHQKLLQDEKRSGKTAQQLLKAAYFQPGGVALLMSEQEKSHLLNEVHRIGHNANQIARKVNAGFAEGFHTEITQVRAQISLLITWLSSKYCRNRLE